MNPYNVFKFIPLSFLRLLAKLVASIMIRLPNLTVKRIIDINLRLAYPHLDAKARHELSYKAINNQCLSSVESIKSWAMPPLWSIEQISKVHNQQVLTEALKNPKGMLAIVPHLGTWEMMNAWLNQFGSPTIMYKPVKGKLSDEFIKQGRERLNAKLVPTDASGVKAIFKTLKSGGFSIILPDHVPHPSGGINAPFFGVETLTSTLASKLASKTKCALVGLMCIRNHKCDPHEPSFDIYCIKLDDPNLYNKDILIATMALNNALEKMINTFPAHYIWSYKRFKSIPVINNPYKLSDDEFDSYIKTRKHDGKIY